MEEELGFFLCFTATAGETGLVGLLADVEEVAVVVAAAVAVIGKMEASASTAGGAAGGGVFGATPLADVAGGGVSIVGRALFSSTGLSLDLFACVSGCCDSVSEEAAAGDVAVGGGGGGEVVSGLVVVVASAAAKADPSS